MRQPLAFTRGIIAYDATGCWIDVGLRLCFLVLAGREGRSPALKGDYNPAMLRVRGTARLVIVSLLPMCLSPGPVTAFAQSLAAVAKKEQARREKPATEEAKSYTDKDLPGYSPIAPGDDETAPDSRKPSAAAKNGGAPTSTASSAAARQEERKSFWRARAASLRSRIQEGEERVRRLDTSRVGGVQVKTCATAGSSDQAMCGDWESLYSRAKRNLEGAKASLAALEDSARRQGIPAGWLR